MWIVIGVAHTYCGGYITSVVGTFTNEQRAEEVAATHNENCHGEADGWEGAESVLFLALAVPPPE